MILPFQAICLENYSGQKVTIVLFFDTLKKPSPTVSDFFLLFSKHDESELELILRQKFPALNWKENWFNNKEALDYINDVYNNPQNYYSRFFQCIKKVEPTLFSDNFNYQIELPPKLMETFREFSVTTNTKKVVFQFSQDEPYIENIYLPNGKNVYTLMEKCIEIKPE
jgi:hypothetical protein